MARRSDERRSIAQNRRARHAFHILEELECGIELRGTEVKSLRLGRASIGEAFGMFRRGELYLFAATIPEYTHGNINNHPPTRERRLLAHARELARWQHTVREKGVTLVPLELYFQGHLVKVRMALVRGKKLFDKRETQREKDARRDVERALGRRR
jgi:SsrA-binding protein